MARKNLRQAAQDEQYAAINAALNLFEMGSANGGGSSGSSGGDPDYWQKVQRSEEEYRIRQAQQRRMQSRGF